jgi:hypothetical protein
LNVLDLGGAEAGGLSLDVVDTAGQEIETKFSVTAGGGGARGSGAGIGSGDCRVGQRGASGIRDYADDVASCGGLSQDEVGGDEKKGEKKDVSKICAHMPSEEKQDGHLKVSLKQWRIWSSQCGDRKYWRCGEYSPASGICAREIWLVLGIKREIPAVNCQFL